MCSALEFPVDFDPTEDQSLLLTSFEGLLDRFRAPSAGEHGYLAYSEAFQAELGSSGYLEIASQPGFGVLEAALLTEAAARCPVGAEVAASTMIGPLIGQPPGPIALAWGPDLPIRYLQQAGSVCLFEDEGVLVGAPEADGIEPVGSVVAYPLAKLVAPLRDAVHYTGEVAATIRRRALIGIAAEAAGLMRGALDQTVRYVNERHQFGQPLGAFQAIQHRMAEDAQLIHGCRLLSLRAAFADDDRQAAVACLYAQQAIRKVVYDLHQFTGAMGLTLEYPLHLWTYRLKYLQGEAGGRGAQGRRVASEVWPRSAPVAFVASSQASPSLAMQAV